MNIKLGVEGFYSFPDKCTMLSQCMLYAYADEDVTLIFIEIKA